MEIQNLDEMLRITNAHADRDKYQPYGTTPMSDSCRQQEVSRSAVEAKKVDLVSSLLRPDGGQEYKKKMEEFAVAVRHHGQSLLLECVPTTLLFI